MLYPMLKLALLRHAKSSWDDPGLDDFDRPLNDRGRHAAAVMGRVLASMNFFPDAVLCSPSKRTRETLARIEPFAGAAQPAIVFDQSLYLAAAGDILARVRHVSGPATCLMVVGHNPGLHTLAAQLAVSGDARQLTRLREKFPTGALAVLSFPAAAWAGLYVQSGHLDAFMTPKDRA